MILGLTGQTGAGKSTVCEMLRQEPGVAIIDADKIAREVVSTGTDCLAEIVLQFSITVLNEDGTLTRKRLAAEVFKDREKLKMLNKITFPHIVAAMRERAEQAIAEGAEIVVLDAPALFESRADKQCDKILAVIAAPEVRRARIMARDGLTEEEANARMNSQHDDAFYTSRAQFVIRNEGEPAALRLQVAELLENLRAKS